MNATLTWNGSPLRDLEPVHSDARPSEFRLLLEVEGKPWNAATTGNHLFFQKWVEAIEKLLNGAQTALVQENEATGFRLHSSGTDTVRMVRESLRAERVDKPVEVPLSLLARTLLREGRALVRFKQKLLPKLPGLLDRVEWMLDRRTR